MGKKMDALDRRFNHRIWYLNSKLTVRDFLELAAESHSFYVTQENKIISDNLFADAESVYIIKCEEGRGKFSITQKEYEYFEVRRTFWRKWEQDFNERNRDSKEDIVDYWERKNREKRDVPEYKIACSKLAIK